MNKYAISFVDKANSIHKNKYQYSSLPTSFKAADKVRIICSTHGIFEQRACNHIRANNPCGCPKCSIETKANSKRSNTEEFVKKAKEKHGEKYDYSITKYTSRERKIKFLCPNHGVVEQTANNHLKYGCGACRRPELEFLYADNPTELFIQKAKEVHGNKYDYSQTRYSKNKELLKIICPKHGEFNQTPDSHISGGCGCPRCNDSKGEREISQWLLQRKIKFQQEVKIKNFNPFKPFDFYVCDFDLYIEYDGKQHFMPHHLSGKNQTNFIKQQERDKKRNEWCAQNGIKLEIITYLEDIPTRLAEIFHKVHVTYLDDLELRLAELLL